MNQDVAVIGFSPQPTLVQLTQVQQFSWFPDDQHTSHLINVHIVYTNRVPTNSPLFAHTHAQKNIKKNSSPSPVFPITVTGPKKNMFPSPSQAFSIPIVPYIHQWQKTKKSIRIPMDFAPICVPSSSPQWAHKLVQLSMKTEDLCIQGWRCQRILASKNNGVERRFLGVSRCQNSWDSGRVSFWNFWMYKVLMLKICYHYWRIVLFRKVWSIFVWEMFALSRFTIWRLLVLLNIMLTIPLLTLEENVPDRR